MRGILVLAAAAAGLLVFGAAPERREWEHAHPPRSGHGQGASLGVHSYEERPAQAGTGRWERRPAQARTGRWERTVAPAWGLSGLDAVRVGRRVVVVGGADYSQSEVKALVLDLGSRRWSDAARSGLPWRAGHSVVAARGEVIVWGGGTVAAAAYDVSRDSWRRIPPGPLGQSAPPTARTRHSAVWTGREMIVWGGYERRRTRRTGAAYDPRTDRWRRIAAAPLSPRVDHAAIWTNDEMLVWGGSRRIRGGRARLLLDGAAYDPEADSWRPLAPAPLRPAPVAVLGQGVEAEVDAVWTGSTAIFWNGHGGAAYLPAGDRWRRLPPPPEPLRYWKPTDTFTWTGREAIAFGGTAPHDSGKFVQTAAAYDPATRRWRMLPPAPIAGRDRHAAIWTGRDLLVWGGCCRGSRHHRDGALYRPR
jgi:hypothetical protein